MNSGKHIPQEIIDTIKERADIVQMLTPYLALKKSGKNYMAPCPFHQETKPSFTVNPIMQIFYCFGCGAKGNVFSFFMQYNNLSFPDAVRFVADRVGITIPEPSERDSVIDSKAKEENERLLEINEITASYFIRILWDKTRGQTGREYLQKRGLSRQIIDEFRLGLSPPPWDHLFKYLRKKGFSETDLINSGLFIQKERSKSAYDRFRGRLMFPISNNRGQIMGFAGRTLTDEDAKYINNPETTIFQKRKLLYGLTLGQESIRKERSILVVEGYFDVISLFQAGIKNVVATCGTALTDEHINLLRRYTRTLKLVFDGDKAGVHAAFRSLEMLIERDFELRVCPLPDGMDPDDYIRSKGNTAFLDIVDNGIKAYPFILEFSQIDKDFSQAEDVLSYLDEISPYLLKISDPVKRSLIIKQAAENVHIDHQDLVQRFRQDIIQRKKAMPSKRPSKTFSTDFEADLIALFLNFPLKIERYEEMLHELTLKNEQLDELRKLLLSVWKKDKISRPDQWLDKWGVLPMKEIVTKLCMSPITEGNVDKQILGWITKARIRTLKQKREECKKKLNIAIEKGERKLSKQINKEMMLIQNQIEELHQQDCFNLNT